MSDCNAEPGCLWFSYHEMDKICLLFETCPRTDGNLDFSSGQSGCDVPILTTIMPTPETTTTLPTTTPSTPSPPTTPAPTTTTAPPPASCKSPHILKVGIMVVQVIGFSSGGCKIRKIFA